MRQHAKTKQRKMMFTLLKRWKIENLSRRWANRRRQAEKKKKTKRKTQLIVCFHCFLIWCHMCVCADIAQNELHSILAGEHPKPFLPSAKCIVRRNLGGTFAHGCQKHASNLYYSYFYSLCHRPNNLCGWIMNGHADTQALKHTGHPLFIRGHPKFISKSGAANVAVFGVLIINSYASPINFSFRYSSPSVIAPLLMPFLICNVRCTCHTHTHTHTPKSSGPRETITRT